MCALAAALAFPSSRAPAQESQGAAGYAWDDPEWRFTYHSRRVKVVLLAGSIGAFRDEPYGRLLNEWCADAEIRNLSRVGFGASQLFGRFRDQVLENPRYPMGARDLELWVLWNGGLNSAAASHRTNHYIRRTFRDAHRRGIRVVGMSLTPWGSLEDERRWGGARGLETQRSTQRIVDFVMGRGTPRDLLGTYASQRDVPEASGWDPSELADVRIDLYDSRLRDRDARPREVAAMRALLQRDSRSRRALEPLPVADRETRLDADAQALSALPQWFLRREYRGFDHIHPNREGHRAIAEIACPQLPASWGCTCPTH